jgi:hypothetical protein
VPGVSTSLRKREPPV